MSSDRSTSEAASHATTSNTSFYELLSLPPEYHPTATQPIPPPISPALLRKTYRKTSLLYHPDKNPSPDAAATFHTLTTAYDVLSDAATKKAYDQALVARLVRKRKTEVMDGERRRLKEELERRERDAAAGGMGMGWKKQKTGGEDDVEENEQEFQRKLAKLKEEGARLRQKREEALRKAEMEAEEEEGGEEERRKAAQQENSTTTTSKSNGTSPISQQANESRFSDLDKTIFLKLLSPPTSPPITEQSLGLTLSSAFGEITSCLIRQPPPPKSSSSKKKKEKEPLATAVVQFQSIISAHHLVHAFRNGSTSEAKAQAQIPPRMDPHLWERIRDVKWASGKDPDLTGLISSSPPPSSSSTSTNPPPPPPSPPLPTKINIIPPTPTATPPTSTSTPKFSFRPPSPQSQTTNSDTFTRPNVSSSDYESITLMRMREMERKLMEAEIRAKEMAMTEAERLKEMQAETGVQGDVL